MGLGYKSLCSSCTEFEVNLLNNLNDESLNHSSKFLDCFRNL